MLHHGEYLIPYMTRTPTPMFFVTFIVWKKYSYNESYRLRKRNSNNEISLIAAQMVIAVIYVEFLICALYT